MLLQLRDWNFEANIATVASMTGFFPAKVCHRVDAGVLLDEHDAFVAELRLHLFLSSDISKHRIVFVLLFQSQIQIFGVFMATKPKKLAKIAENRDNLPTAMKSAPRRSTMSRQSTRSLPATHSIVASSLFLFISSLHAGSTIAGTQILSEATWWVLNYANRSGMTAHSHVGFCDTTAVDAIAKIMKIFKSILGSSECGCQNVNDCATRSPGALYWIRQLHISLLLIFSENHW